MPTATFYHAGCPVCLDAERQLLQLLDDDKVDVEVVHVGERPLRRREATAQGVHSVPALVLDGGAAIHLNHGADLADLD